MLIIHRKRFENGRTIFFYCYLKYNNLFFKLFTDNALIEVYCDVLTMVLII